MGDLITTRRIAAGFTTQRAFAESIGKDRSWVSRLESGVMKEMPTPGDLALVADAIGATQAELIAAAGYDVATGNEGDSQAVLALRPVLNRFDFDEEDIENIRYMVEGFGRMLTKRT